MAETSGARRVIIIGGGFAGLFAARMLARAPVQVTLLDRAEHHLFQPMLYQCATGILSEGKIAAPLRQLLAKHRNVEFVIAEVNGIDAERRTVLAQRPLAGVALTEAAPTPAWRTRPVWAILGTADLCIDPGVHRFSYERMGATITEIEGSSHVAMISHPQEVAEVVMAAVRGTAA